MPDIQAPVVIANGPPDIVIAIVALTTLAVGGVLLWPLVRAWARRIENRGAPAELLNEVEHLRDRVAELEGVQSRVAELEERADFAERLLVKAQERDALPRAGE